MMNNHPLSTISPSSVMGILVITTILCIVPIVQSDILLDNELIKTTEVFDLQYALDSNVSAAMPASVNGQAKYYCVYRSNWNKKNHPNYYPTFARVGNPMIFSHTKEYVPFLQNEEAPAAIEKIAESGFVDMFVTYLEGAGSVADDYSIGDGFEIKQDDEEVDTENYEYLKTGVNVSYDYRFLSGITGIQPSPDWYTGFYLHDTVKEIGQTFWEHFVLRTYPWDAGTDKGEKYEDSDEDMDPPGVMTRFEVSNDVNQIFTFNDEIQYIAEWECVLHVCPVDEPGCVKDNWPPPCDVLRFPLCATTCDPNAPESASTTSALAVDSDSNTTSTTTTTSACTKCHNGKYHEDCCLAGTRPVDGFCDGSLDTTSAAAAAFYPHGRGGTMIVSTLFMLLTLLPIVLL